ncbi:site-specific integrase [Qipengyuania aurantiaca]|uniref:Site-specific integrase n=1 Tax=Qipengyuania aurantiaca TaxID=2867233 RepID=A0ABX8ZP61_9SPHN|nr:site-specific integrase [Qipengyuania aurantiaca]QZD89899.1 site-specific integrase [Qipengyuania aurantiaca]
MNEAKDVLRDFLAQNIEIEEGTRPENFPIEYALIYYGENHAPTTAAPERIAYAMDALLPFWSEFNVGDITQATCNSYAAFRNQSRAKGISQSTLRKELATLTAAINFCVRERKLTQTVYVPLPAKSAPKDRWLTVSEVARLLWESRKGGLNTRSYLPLFVLIALYTGARVEAILSLTWDRVDLESKRIDFQIPGRRITKKRRPKIPISSRLLPFLKYAHSRRTADNGPVIHDEGQKLIRIIRSFKAAAKRAGLTDVTPHTMRHTCATWMAQKGVSMWQIAGFLGQDVETTSRHYAHHSLDFMQDAVRSTERRK